MLGLSCGQGRVGRRSDGLNIHDIRERGDAGYSDDDGRGPAPASRATEISQDTAGSLHGVPGPPWWHPDDGDSGADDNEETHAEEISPDHEAPGRMETMMTDLSHPDVSGMYEPEPSLQNWKRRCIPDKTKSVFQ